MSTKSKVIGVRVDAITNERLSRFESKTHVEAVTLIRAAMEATLDYFDKHQSISFPLEIQPSPMKVKK